MPSWWSPKTQFLTIAGGVAVFLLLLAVILAHGSHSSSTPKNVAAGSSTTSTTVAPSGDVKTSSGASGGTAETTVTPNGSKTSSTPLANPAVNPPAGSASTTPSGSPATTVTTPPTTTTTPSGEVFYPNCDAVVGTIRRGEPGYRTALDRNNDGVACDSADTSTPTTTPTTTTTTTPPRTTTTTTQPPVVAPGRINTAPTAYGRILGARLMFGAAPANGNSNLHYQFSATRTCRCPIPQPIGWTDINGGSGTVVPLPSNGVSSSSDVFQVRACNDQGMCGEPSPSSSGTPIYDRVSTPVVTVVRNGTETDWTIKAAESSNPPYALYAPISSFRVHLNGQETDLTVIHSLGDAVSYFHSSHIVDGSTQTLTVTAVGDIDGNPISAEGAATVQYGTFAPTFTAEYVGPETVRVTWSGVDPIKLARNGVDSTGFPDWDTGPFTPGLATTFDFTGILHNTTYVFTLYYAANSAHPAGQITTQLRT